MTEIWDLWQDQAHSPAMNMALDEALMLTAGARGRPLLRLYEWDRDAVSIGYVQRLAQVPKDQGTIVRRPTGGGIVFHKQHFTYTVVLPNDHWIVKDTQPVESYNLLNKAVQASLDLLEFESQLATEEIPKAVDRASMVCFVTPTKYDLVADKRKIAGSAQRRTKSGMLHQGSIEMAGVERFTSKKMRDVLPNGFKKSLNCQFKAFSPLEELLKIAGGLSVEKYDNDVWNGKR